MKWNERRFLLYASSIFAGISLQSNGNWESFVAASIIIVALKPFGE